MKELIKIIYSAHVAVKLQNIAWTDLNTEKETQIATRGKGKQGKFLSLDFMCKERLKEHVVNATKYLFLYFDLETSYYHPPVTTASEPAWCV